MLSWPEYLTAERFAIVVLVSVLLWLLKDMRVRYEKELARLQSAHDAEASRLTESMILWKEAYFTQQQINEQHIDSVLEAIEAQRLSVSVVKAALGHDSQEDPPNEGEGGPLE